MQKINRAACAYVVNMNNGNVNNNNKDYNNIVRPVSEFQTAMNAASPLSGLEGWFEAYYNCRRNKARSYNASRFEARYEHNLLDLWCEVETRTYHPGRSVAFLVYKPVLREIFAADFRDRVVHHWIALRIEPLLERQFVDESYNCRKGKGTLAGIRAVGENIRRISENYTKECWVMKLDLKNFFMSINRERLAEKLCWFLENEYMGDEKETLLFLCRTVLTNAPEKNCIIRGRREEWTKLSRGKSLFTNKPGFGLPIGNLTSQLAANFLLDETDHFIQDTLGLSMARYVDDFCIVDQSKEKLLRSIPLIREHLRQTADATLHPKKFYLQHYTKGVKFIGAVIKPGRSYVSNRTVNNAMMRVHGFNALSRQPGFAVKNAEAFASSINSYLGIMRHYVSYSVRRKLIGRIGAAWRRVVEPNKDFTKLTVKPQYKHRNRIATRIRNKRLKPCHSRAI